MTTKQKMEACGVVIHQMGLNDIWFEYIRTGHKKYEARVYDEKRRTVKIGDCIKFTNSHNNDSIMKTVSNILIYKSFEEMIKRLGIENVLPGVEMIEKGVEIYENISDYKEKSLKYGVVAFEFYSF